MIVDGFFVGLRAGHMAAAAQISHWHGAALIHGQRWRRTIFIAAEVRVPRLQNQRVNKQTKLKFFLDFFFLHSFFIRANKQNTHRVHRRGITQPRIVHFFDISGCGAVQERFGSR